MLERGYTRNYAEQMFERIMGFGSYGLPESHAASFALVTYAICWLKCHESAAFTAGVINSQPMGFYTPDQLLQDVRRKGIQVLPVDVRHSDWDRTLEFVDGDSLSNPAIRIGLRLINGFSQDVAGRISEVRQRRPFNDIADLYHRADVDCRHQALLAESGALKGLSGHRHRARLTVAGVEARLSLFDGLPQTFEPSPVTLLLTVVEDMVADYTSIGLTVTDTG